MYLEDIYIYIYKEKTRKISQCDSESYNCIGRKNNMN